MDSQSRPLWDLDHSFGQGKKRTGENRTLVVIAITTIMMTVEVVAGWYYHSMALLADGLHMGAHAAALAIAAAAYIFARRHATNPKFNFGTGKMNSLAGYTSAILLVLFAVTMAIECTERLLVPVEIAWDDAIMVAVLGLVVNVVSMFVLRDEHDHSHSHDHDHLHDSHHDCSAHDHSHDRALTGTSESITDHNLRAAYLHVLADTLTSVLAIVGLILGKYQNIVWVDPLVGILGAILVAKWSVGLLSITGRVLLDLRSSDTLYELLRASVERETDAVVDLHVWSIGPKLHAAEITLLVDHLQPIDVYHQRIPQGIGIAHAHIEVHVRR